MITATVAGHHRPLAVSVGLHEQPVADFDDAAAWNFSQARASGSVAPTPEGQTARAWS